MDKTAIIIGAGPAGLTAAYELLHRTDIKPVILEMSGQVGGICKTVVYKGNRIDFGGHRFFTKSGRVLEWWLDLLPLQRQVDPKTGEVTEGPDPEHEDRVMLVRDRISRIYFLRSFFDYPISLSADTFRKLGLARSVRIALSYLRTALFPIKNVENIEQLIINRFGRELYNIFFKSYTEKVWGVPCSQISADWGEQRIKDLSVSRAVAHYLKGLFKRQGDLRQKDTSTSLIERFMYPKFGPGQMWEEAARVVCEKGGQIHFGQIVTAVKTDGSRVVAVRATNELTGETTEWPADYFLSTMPVKELFRGLDSPVPKEVGEVADGLQYRDFMTVGLLVNRLKLGNDTPSPAPRLVPDTWMYIQEKEVKLGRVQIYNNWSRYMVADPDRTVWLGLEYFCSEGDELWRKPDEEFLRFAVGELAGIDIIDPEDVLDGTVMRMKSTYPAYVGTYERFNVVRRYVDRFDNLFLIGRNGMHRYNNMDHSMLTAMAAVDNIAQGITDKDNIWAVNTEQAYHEKK